MEHPFAGVVNMSNKYRAISMGAFLHNCCKKLTENLFSFPILRKILKSRKDFIDLIPSGCWKDICILIGIKILKYC